MSMETSPRLMSRARQPLRPLELAGGRSRDTLTVINQKVVDRLLELNPETAAANRGCLASAPRPLARPTKAFSFAPKCRDLGK